MRLGPWDWKAVLGDHYRMLGKADAAHDGRVVEIQGVGFMMFFTETEDAMWDLLD